MTTDVSTPTVEHDPGARRFSTTVDGHLAVLDYALSNRVMTILHTGVPEPIEGRGIAAALMRAALDAAHAGGWTVSPACSYAAAFMRRRAEEERNAGASVRDHREALLDEALDESFPASDPPSVGRSS
jgi:predicted GNAT family acetyltransferase